AEGRVSDSVARLEMGLGLMNQAGADIYTPFFGGVYASALADEGRMKQSTEIERDVVTKLDQGSEQWAAAEIYRMIADADYWHRGAVDKAIDGLQRAIEVAKGQDAKLWELRATVSLARIWGDQGEKSQGLALLTPVVEDFPIGGRDLADVAMARTLLQQLA
ncbi:MAG: hypothetical protein WBD34_25000, partial [Burkholderiaceae bacterium]